VSGKGNFFRLQLYLTAFLVACNLVAGWQTFSCPSLASSKYILYIYIFKEKRDREKPCEKAEMLTTTLTFATALGASVPGCLFAS